MIRKRAQGVLDMNGGQIIRVRKVDDGEYELLTPCAADLDQMVNSLMADIDLPVPTASRRLFSGSTR